MDYFPIQTTPFSLNVKIKSKIWSLINNTIYKYSPFFANKFRIALVKVFGGKISWNCSLNRHSIIDHPWNLSMEDFASLGEKSWAYCLDRIHIGRYSCIGKDVFLLTGSHNFESKYFELITKPIKIEHGCWVSTGVYVLPGVTINEFSVVAAGSVVTKDVSSWTIVGGNPATFIKKRIIKN